MRRCARRSSAWVRKTGGKAWLCPEMTYELDKIGRLLYEPAPGATSKRNACERKTFWLPDEASSIYKRAALVMSAEYRRTRRSWRWRTGRPA